MKTSAHAIIMTATVWTQRLATSREGVTHGCMCCSRGSVTIWLALQGQPLGTAPCAMWRSAVCGAFERTNRTYVELEEGERAGAESTKQRQADNEEEAKTNGNVEACIYSILF